MKLLFTTLILLIVGSIYAGSLGCSLGGCILSIPFSAFISIVLGLIVATHLREKKGIRWYTYLALLIIYLLLSTVIAFFSLGTFHNLNNTEYYKKELKQLLVQDYQSVKVGKILESNQNLIYENKNCGYKLQFPSDWGFSEYSSNNPNTIICDLTITTSDYTNGSKSKDNRGFSLVIYTYPKTQTPRQKVSEYMRGDHNKLSVLDINNEKAEMGKSIFRNENRDQKSAVIQFSSQTTDFKLEAKFYDEKDFDQKIDNFLKNLKFLY